MTRFVVDASTTAAWWLSDEYEPKRTCSRVPCWKALRAVVPSVWILDAANIIWAARRRNRITESQAADCFRLLKGLPIIIEHEPAARVFDAVWNLAVRTDISVYDAAYLELAVREGLPLASLDGPLARAAERVGVELV